MQLEFPDPPVTFKLIEGTGPVHIHGQYIPVELFTVDSGQMISDEEVSEAEDDVRGNYYF